MKIFGFPHNFVIKSDIDFKCRYFALFALVNNLFFLFFLRAVNFYII